MTGSPAAAEIRMVRFDSIALVRSQGTSRRDGRPLGKTNGKMQRMVENQWFENSLKNSHVSPPPKVLKKNGPICSAFWTKLVLPVKLVSSCLKKPLWIQVRVRSHNSVQEFVAKIPSDQNLNTFWPYVCLCWALPKKNWKSKIVTPHSAGYRKTSPLVDDITLSTSIFSITKVKDTLASEVLMGKKRQDPTRKSTLQVKLNST